MQIADGIEKWSVSKPGSYQFEMQLECYCEPESLKPYRVIVSGDRFGVVFVESGAPVSWKIAQLPFVGPIDKIYSYLVKLLEDKPQYIRSITIDRKLGYPTSIVVGPGGFDGDVKVTISNFKYSGA